MTSVASSSSCTSTTWNGARSICEYCLAAPTSAEIRVVASSISFISISVSTVYASQRTAPSVADPGTRHRLASQATSSAGVDQRRRQVPAAADAVLLQPVGELVLGVAGLDRAELRRLGDPLDGLLLQLDQRRQRPGSIRAVGDHRQLVPHPGDPLAQRGGGPHRGRGRVVQLVGQPGRQRAEREQPLPLADEPLAVPHAEEEPLEQVHRHREPLPHLRAPLGRRQQEDPQSVTASTVAPYVDWARSVLQVGLGGAGVGRRVVGPVDLDLVAAGQPGQHERAGQQHEEAGGLVALGDHRLARRDRPRPAVLGQPVQLVVAQRLEQEQRPQLVAARSVTVLAVGCSLMSSPGSGAPA